jgi:hypothetical protein
MAIVFMDGFDHYGLHGSGMLFDEPSTNHLQLKGWNNGNAILNWEVYPAFARGGIGMGLANKNSGAYIYRAVADATSYVVGVAYQSISGFIAQKIIELTKSDGTSLCDLRADGTGHLVVTRAGTTLATSTNAMSLATWYYIEFKALVNSSTGTYEVRVDGTATNWIPAATGANTGTGNIGRIYLEGGAAKMYFDDLYIADTNAPNNDFLGPCKVSALRAAAPGNYAQWTGNGGVNFANVNDLPLPDGDTTFNQSATANQIDSHVFEDLPASAGSVFAIQHCIYSKQDAGAQRTITAFQRSGGTDYASANTKNTTASYAYYLDVKNVNPADAAAWDVADINGAEFGVKITA